MKKKHIIVGLIFLIFFVISFITNILNSILPNIKDSFELSLGLVSFLPFSFFLAYGVMSIPAGILVEKYNEKIVILISFLIALLGAFIFASFPSFQIALLSLFLIGIGMAMLQVAINPLLRITGGATNFAFYSVMAQLIFGAASAISPLVYSFLVEGLNQYSGEGGIFFDILSNLIPSEMPWVSLYWIFTMILIVMVGIIAFVKFEKVDLTENEKSGTLKTYRELLKNRNVILFFIGIFTYVGTEQGIGNWISVFLKEYHNFDPEIQGAQTVSYFWLFLTLGCLLGLVLLKLVDSRKILIAFSLLAIIALTFALFGSGEMALIAFPVLGFCISVMWSIIFSLALNSVPKNHGSFSGILCTGIMGGAIVPSIIGFLGDFIGLKLAMTFLFLTLGYIFSIGFWSKPLITNKVLNFGKV